MDQLEDDMDIEIPPSRILDVDTKQIVSNWLKDFEEGRFINSEPFNEYWKTYVPQVYSPTPKDNTLCWYVDDDEARRVLITTLEEFICGGEDISILTGHNVQLDKPPSVCGKVFKMGEPTYSCRECGMDNTCVLCAECFKQSDHRFHKYKMGTSAGGGCCDCGDVEAWRRSPYCELHKMGKECQGQENKAGLPEALSARTRLVFEAVLEFAYDLLTSSSHSADLGLREENLSRIDSYCTVLYNDEIHTFEQVISTLTRVLKCHHRNAIEFVTNIDREGRALVKCSNFVECQDLKFEIEKHTSRHGKPLKVLVVHSHAVARQVFAMKLLSWLQGFLGHGEGFRSIFAEIVLKPRQNKHCIVKGILLGDCHLWKSARTHWHHLLISGMLLEYDNKKELAKIFTKNYGSVMKDFIKDDHDHSYSISSLSVQLFTVPTIAHYLIAHEDILFIILNTFVSECSRKCNKYGKLEFERNMPNQAFKRAQYTLYDLRYLLSVVPKTWTNDLRKGFLQGLSVMLNLMTMMQGMDAASRQVGQHMEYEPEWESAFNLHIKLSYCISLALEWCGTDDVVLIKAYRLTLKKLQEHPCYDPIEAGEVREMADHSVACLHYDVSTKPVSIHLPITRFLAGLHLHLERYGLHFVCPKLQVANLTPVQIMEPVLRAQVMIAQVHAGMWRRNGYALLNQLFFYHNVKCRTEMFDRDVVLMQIAASLIESNEFLIHVLNKFNLINWAGSNFEIHSLKSPEEDSMRQTISLVEEFLQLMIVIIGERFVPGISNVTTEDRIRKEIIQQLCIKPLPHSELNKTIPDELTHEMGLEEVIGDLADFKKPTHGNGKGTYELKEPYYEQYNVFFYHYTREELSKSEENQRKRRKARGELECCPPPKLPKVKESFHMLVNLLQCDVMLHVLCTVLERCANLRARSFSEIQLHKVLHLIGYALQEEESKEYPFFVFTEKATRAGLFALMEQVVNSPRVEAHKDLVRWIMTKYKSVASIPEQMMDLVVHQATKEPSTSEMDVEDEKERRAKLAAQKRAKIMEQMAAMQRSFMRENAKHFEEAEGGAASNDLSGSAMDLTEHFDQPVALGPNQTSRVITDKTFVCILCQEEEKVSLDGTPLVLAAFVQQSTVLCVNRTRYADNPLYLNANLGPAPHTSTCGHVMHATCWQKYFDSVMLKEHRRPYRLRHPASFNIDKQEFLCPLCECLSNTVLPLIPPLGSIAEGSEQRVELAFDEWLGAMVELVGKTVHVCHGVFECDALCTNVHCRACSNASDGDGNQEATECSPDCEANCTSQTYQILYAAPVTPKNLTLGNSSEAFCKLFESDPPKLDQKLVDIIHLFTQATYTRGLNVNPHPTDMRVALIAWKSLAYTIHSVEVLLRDAGDRPLLGHLSSRHRDCLEGFVRVAGVLGTTWSKSAVISSHALQLLSVLLDNDPEMPCILDWDSLGVLVALTFSLGSVFNKDKPAAIPTGGTLEWHILRLVFTCHVTKILIQLEPKDVLPPSEDAINYNVLVKLVEEIHKERDFSETTGTTIWNVVKEASRPFLRCCALFYHYLTDVPAPDALTETSGDTFENMCKYLSLPDTPTEFLTETTQKLIIDWSNHDKLRTVEKRATYRIYKEPLPLNRLMSLPNDYSDLMNAVSCFTCPCSDHDESRNPTMCLVCSRILCSQSYCCQTELNKMVVGACTYHAHVCGAGVGVFLRVRECELLFLAAPNKGCVMSAPYVDDYGETDEGLRRGYPLHLCEQRYRKLQMLWLGHSVHEEIARAIEGSSNVLGTQWHHL